MKRATRGALCVLAVTAVGLASSTVDASAETGATIILENPARPCAGEAATLSWTPPAGIDDLVGYQISLQPSPRLTEFPITRVGPDQTSLAITVPRYDNLFEVRAITSTGVVSEPFGRAFIFGNHVPAPLEWTHQPVASDVGDGTASVHFAWSGPLKWFQTGGLLPTTVRVTASPGGSSIESPAPHNTLGVTSIFTGLTNGTGYTFSAVTSNACGSSSSFYPTAVYTPGVRPSWLFADPPTTVRKNKTYQYQFVASGDPSPTYRLEGAPAWLNISPDGLVSGEPPKQTTSFSYSIIASNSVGIPYSGIRPVEVVAGPFTVTVTKGRPA